VKVSGRSALVDFCAKHPDAQGWIEGWLAEVEGATWTAPQQIKDRYASASFLAQNRVIFNVRGNHYRLEIVVAYRTGIVVVSWLGTHAEYDERNRKR
jgi:mRNA interferase HigB